MANYTLKQAYEFGYEPLFTLSTGSTVLVRRSSSSSAREPQAQHHAFMICDAQLTGDKKKPCTDWAMPDLYRIDTDRDYRRETVCTTYQISWGSCGWRDETTHYARIHGEFMLKLADYVDELNAKNLFEYESNHKEWDARKKEWDAARRLIEEAEQKIVDAENMVEFKQTYAELVEGIEFKTGDRVVVVKKNGRGKYSTNGYCQTVKSGQRLSRGGVQYSMADSREWARNAEGQGYVVYFERGEAKLARVRGKKVAV